MEKKYVLRTQLQVDVSPVLKRKIKETALGEEKSLRDFVLTALAGQYPALKPYVNGDLHKLWDRS